VDELLAEYSQWPFGKKAGANAGVGANLGQVIAEVGLDIFDLFCICIDRANVT